MSVTTEVPSRALIGGDWVEGSGGSFEVRSPHSREVVNVVTRCDASDVDRAVAAAREAQPGWAAMPLIDRVKILRRINQLFLERAEPIARMVSLEIGKTITDSREEVYEYAAPSYEKAGAEVLRHRGLSFPSTQEQTNNKRLVMTHRPLGVVGAITPYNFPTDISSIALAHIIAAGNTAIWKPSEFSPTCCAMVAELFGEAGLPPGRRQRRPGLRRRRGGDRRATTTSTASSSPARPPPGRRSRPRPAEAAAARAGRRRSLHHPRRRRHRRRGRGGDERLLLLHRPGLHLGRAAAGPRRRLRRVRGQAPQAG